MGIVNWRPAGRPRLVSWVQALLVAGTVALAVGGGGSVFAAGTGPPSNSSLPTISGTLVEGQTLTGDPGTWSGTDPISYAYQWRSCNSSGGSCSNIKGAANQTYTLTSSDAKHTVRLVVTASNPAGSGTASSATTAVIAAAVKPSNKSLPTISGTAQQGQALTGDPGTWSGTEPISYAYQWRRCNSTGGSCSNIAAATNQTYTLSSADIARTIRLVVTASNVAGSNNATSATTAVVGAPVNTSRPTISGTAQQGQTLTGTAGTWSGTDPISYAYRWRRCDAAGANCTDISGATSLSYTLTTSDGGKTIRFRVTAANVAGSATVDSDATGVVLVPPSNTALPTITGTTQPGQTLTGAAGTWSGTDPISYAYQWRRCDSAGGSCADIANATSQTYALTTDDLGSTIRFSVTGSNSVGSSVATSAATAVVAPAAVSPSNTALPTITGVPKHGQTLTADPGTWSGTAPITYGYQWQRCTPPYASVIGADSPLGYWRFAETTGTTASDQTANGLNGTYVGGYTLGQPGALTPPNPAVTLDGTSGYVSVPDAPALAYGDTFTYELWAKVSTLGPTHTLVQKGSGGARLYIAPDGRLALRKSGTDPDLVASTTSVSAGAFHYIVATKSGSTVRLYLDGADVTGTVTNQTISTTTSPLLFGVAVNGTSGFLNGTIDEAAVYGTALTPSQIQQHYKAATGGACANIVGASGSTYALASGDIGRTVRVVVTGTNSAGSSSATSAQTESVTTPGYRGPSFAGAGVAPSGSKPESKLWWNDGFWWASMWDAGSGSFHIFKLNLGSQTCSDTGTQIDNRPSSRADALWDGSHLYIASHVFATCGCSDPSLGDPARLYRYGYDSATKTYTLDTGFPVAINQTQSETLVLDKDSTGELWATWVQSGNVYVNRTIGGGDSAWGQPFILPGTGSTGLNPDDISSVVAFGGNKIGVMWSNQSNVADSAIYFAEHADGQSDTSWTGVRTAIQGPETADDHINLKSLQADNGRVFAAIKTSSGDAANPSPDATLLYLLARDPSTGAWSSYPYGRVVDDHTRPIVMIDQQHRVIHMFATAPVASGTIYEKTSPLDNISFPVGLGTPFIEDPSDSFLNNATSTKQNVNSTTGLVVVATNDDTGFYWHNYESLGP